MKNNHNIIYYGSDILKQSAKPVETFSQEVRNLVDEMELILQKAKGYGLAAPQIGVSSRVVVIDLSGSNSGDKIVIINPEILWHSDDNVLFDEGCLSVPGIYEPVSRPSKVKVSACNINGEKIEINADGLLARVLQHEIDHLNGILFIDHIDSYIKKEYTKELKKIKKMNKL